MVDNVLSFTMQVNLLTSEESIYVSTPYTIFGINDDLIVGSGALSRSCRSISIIGTRCHLITLYRFGTKKNTYNGVFGKGEINE